MEKYYATLRDSKGRRRELLFQADDYAHVEEQALQCVERDETIIKIEADFLPAVKARHIHG